MTNIGKYTKEVAAAKCGMSARTARKYLRSGKLPSEVGRKCRQYPKKHVLYEVWDEIEAMLKRSPDLKNKTILAYLMDKYGDKFNNTHLRKLQYLTLNWRRESGPDKEVIFAQDIAPGKQSQSDYTNMNDLGITIAGVQFDHLLFHFMLPYSCWEDVDICYSESFESLSSGYEKALWKLGAVAPNHRTDNLSAVAHFVAGKRLFTSSWQEIMDYYGVVPSCNNPGKSHENGSVEKSHDLIKNDIYQLLALRGSKNFSTIEEYREFLDKLLEKRNSRRKERLALELKLLKPLPERKYYAPLIIEAKVSKFSTVRLASAYYSVPSRLIGARLRAYIYRGEIELYYGDKLIQKMPKLAPGEQLINYQHIITSLVRKPGAFASYCYFESLFPTPIFRKTYDCLKSRYPVNSHKHYLQILLLAYREGEHKVENILKELLAKKITPEIGEVKKLIKTPVSFIPTVKINLPLLSDYDNLLTSKDHGGDYAA